MEPKWDQIKSLPKLGKPLCRRNRITLESNEPVEEKYSDTNLLRGRKYQSVKIVKGFNLMPRTMKWNGMSCEWQTKRGS